LGHPLVGAGTPAETRLAGFSDDSEAPFVAELTADGELIDVIQGKSNTAWAHSLARLGDGGIAVTGTFEEKLVLDPDGENEMTFESPLNERVAGTHFRNSFVARYGPSRELVFALRVDGEEEHNGDKVLALPNGGFLALGTFQEAVSFGPYKVTSMSEETRRDNAVYLTAFDAADRTVWLTAISGTGEIDIGDAALSEGEYLYITGSFSGTVAFGRTDGEETLSSRGDSDIYLAK
jgi:hypothetical protein